MDCRNLGKAAATVSPLDKLFSLIQSCLVACDCKYGLVSAVFPLLSLLINTQTHRKVCNFHLFLCDVGSLVFVDINT